MKNFISILILISLSLTFQNLKAQNDVCQFVAKISVSAVSAGAFRLCIKTGNPAACTIGHIANNCALNPSCNGVVDYFVKNSCQYTVEKVGDYIQISGSAYREYSADLRRTYNSLNSVSGIHWLMRYLN